VTTATQTAPTTELADRFRCESEVPDPPRDAAGRKQYWEDTVAEAVAELRRRLASQFDQKSFEALQMILDLEKTRLRHKAPVAGTQLGGGRWADGLEPLPVYTESDREYALKKEEPKTEDLTPPAAPATLSVPERVEDTVAEEPTLPTSPRRGEVGGDAAGRGAGSPALAEGSRQTDSPSYPFPPKPAHPIPLHIRVKLQDGIRGHFADHDDDWMLERGRGRRQRDTGAETEVVEPTIPLFLPAPRPLPRVKNFDLFSPRPEAVLGEPAA